MEQEIQNTEPTKILFLIESISKSHTPFFEDQNFRRDLSFSTTHFRETMTFGLQF